MFSQSISATLQAIRMLGWISARSAQDCASPRQNAAHARKVEWHGFVFQQSPPTFEKANEFILIMKNSLAHYGAYDRVETGTIASAG
jgi:hypothetical protein